MISKKQKFLQFMGGKNFPNIHEKELFKRTKNYLEKIKNIRWIKMIAVCNSLSMFATHDDSDIDLFIVTEKSMIWYVRFFVTLYFWRYGVWRKWKDIAWNFCLSFFVTEENIDMSKISISGDIYMYFWVYFLRPILNFDETYENFTQVNSRVKIDEVQMQDNKKYISFQGKSQKIYFWHFWINNFIKFFLKQKTLRQFKKIGKPKWVIISDGILKFHDKDQREIIRDSFEIKDRYKKNF